MTDRPAIMSAPMVRAVLRELAATGSGKTMTRRLAWRPEGEPRTPLYIEDAHATIWQRVKPGDRLWVRETWAPLDRLAHGDPGATALAARGFYAADRSTVEGEIRKWTPSIHMPREFSRLTLMVTAVKIERLQDISADDAVAEGLWYCEEGGAAGFWFTDPSMDGPCGEGAVDCFEKLWDSLHGDGAWDANPEVVAVSFKPHLCNIDQLRIAA